MAFPSPRPSSPTTATASSFGQGWRDTSMEMIASSMMLVTITEEQTTHVGYKTTRSGMGSAMSRKSVKTNLSMLATTSSDCSMDVSEDEQCLTNSFYSNTSQGNQADEWGFFADGP